MLQPWCANGSLGNSASMWQEWNQTNGIAGFPMMSALNYSILTP